MIAGSSTVWLRTSSPSRATAKCSVPGNYSEYEEDRHLRLG
ncbi:MAG: hypothetical protein R2873_08635 [Caldilineaceae bacterium]